MRKASRVGQGKPKSFPLIVVLVATTRARTAAASSMFALADLQWWHNSCRSSVTATTMITYRVKDRF